MTKKFSKLRAKMEVSVREEVEQKIQNMLAETPLHEMDAGDANSFMNQLAAGNRDYSKNRIELFKRECVKSLVANRQTLLRD